MEDMNTEHYMRYNNSLQFVNMSNLDLCNHRMDHKNNGEFYSTVPY